MIEKGRPMTSKSQLYQQALMDTIMELEAKLLQAQEAKTELLEAMGKIQKQAHGHSDKIVCLVELDEIQKIATNAITKHSTDTEVKP